MYKIVDESILFFSLKILSRSSLHFVGIRVFILGYEIKCEKSLFSKTRCTDESLNKNISRDCNQTKHMEHNFQTKELMKVHKNNRETKDQSNLFFA